MFTTSNKVARSSTDGRVTENVSVLSVSDGPCCFTVIDHSSASGEIVTVSDATGGLKGEEYSLGCD